MLTSITPLDGRYDLSELSEFVSEYALIRLRVEIEIKYLIKLSNYKIIPKVSPGTLLSILYDFDLAEAEKVKLIESTTRHDVKAVEIYLRERVPPKIREFVHIGITSEDINNIAYRLMLQSTITIIIVPILQDILNNLVRAEEKPMLARTHGQAAAPTTWGHEMKVFHTRLKEEIRRLEWEICDLTGKFNGAVGNFYALKLAYPDIDWDKFSREFVNSFSLDYSSTTTQINPFEDIIVVFQNIQRINGILLDYVQDMWRYISDGWLKLKVEKNEVGSSTLPQKVNPIDFENAEGNLVLANGLAQTMIDKLYVSRLQRDLSNSTIMRNIGTLLGYCLVAYKSILSGMDRVSVDTEAMKKALEADYSIYAEALQVRMRKEGLHDAYDLIASRIKGKTFTKEEWDKLVRETEWLLP